MGRGKYTYDTEKKCLVPYEPAEKPLELHAVIADEIPGGMESMVDGRIYTSKALYRQHLRERGFVEKGNDRAIFHAEGTREYDRQIEEDAQRTYYELRDGMAPLSELDRERCKIADHALEHYNYDRRHYDDDGRPLE